MIQHDGILGTRQIRLANCIVHGLYFLPQNVFFFQSGVCTTYFMYIIQSHFKEALYFDHS